MKRITLTDDQYRLLVEGLESYVDGYDQEHPKGPPCDEYELLNAIESTAETITDTR